MSDLLSLFPLLVAAVLGVGLLSSIASLFRRYQHPWQIFVRALSSAGILAILGIMGIIPSALWWAPWLVTLALAAGVVAGCRRLLVTAPPAEPTKREAKLLAPPHPVNLGIETALYLALLAVALIAG